MPLHDWTRVPAGLFHDFHQSWSVRTKDALNAGRLPKGFSAFVEQRTGPVEGDVLAIEERGRLTWSEVIGGVALAEKPVASIVRRSSKEIYAGRANRIVVKHQLGRTVSVVEIVSPGNKDSRSALRDFVEKAVEYLKKQVHLLVVDPFPPTSRDPFGIHKAIWDEVEEQPFQLPEGKDRLLVSYLADREKTAYIEPIGVGDCLPDMPLFLTAELHVKVPLESTYQATWDHTPQVLQEAVLRGHLANAEDE